MTEIEYAEHEVAEYVPKRKKGISKATARFRRFCVVVLILLFVWWFNNYTLKTNYQEISSPKISKPFRIAVISDLHASKHGISNSSILKRITKADPDIVFILGDMYTRNSTWELIQIPIDLTALIVNSGYSTYFVTGDHDTNREYVKKIREVGAHVMNYETEKITVKGNNLQIFGIDNVSYTSTFDLSNEFDIDENCYSILMAHIPNYNKFAAFGADLTLCADTHGDMIQIPFIGAAYDVFSGRWLPTIFGKGTVYDKGFFDYDNGTMFISSGIGASPVPARFNNRPEVVIMDILPKQ